MFIAMNRFRVPVLWNDPIALDPLATLRRFRFFELAPPFNFSISEIASGDKEANSIVGLPGLFRLAYFI